MDRLGGRGSEARRSQGPGDGGNDNQLPDDREDQSDRKVASRSSNPSVRAIGQEGRSSFLHDIGDVEGLTREQLVRARAEDTAIGHPPETSLQLDSIRSRDLGSIDLPKYAETRNTISFPEKVSLLESTVQKTWRLHAHSNLVSHWCHDVFS